MTFAKESSCVRAAGKQQIVCKFSSSSVRKNMKQRFRDQMQLAGSIRCSTSSWKNQNCRQHDQNQLHQLETCWCQHSRSWCNRNWQQQMQQNSACSSSSTFWTGISQQSAKFQLASTIKQTCSSGFFASQCTFNLWMMPQSGKERSLQTLIPQLKSLMLCLIWAQVDICQDSLVLHFWHCLSSAKKATVTRHVAQTCSDHTCVSFFTVTFAQHHDLFLCMPPALQTTCLHFCAADLLSWSTGHSRLNCLWQWWQALMVTAKKPQTCEQICCENCKFFNVSWLVAGFAQILNLSLFHGHTFFMVTLAMPCQLLLKHGQFRHVFQPSFRADLMHVLHGFAFFDAGRFGAWSARILLQCMQIQRTQTLFNCSNTTGRFGAQSARIIFNCSTARPCTFSTDAHALTILAKNYF